MRDTGSPGGSPQAGGEWLVRGRDRSKPGPQAVKAGVREAKGAFSTGARAAVPPQTQAGKTAEAGEERDGEEGAGVAGREGARSGLHSQSRCFFLGPMISWVVALHTVLDTAEPVTLCWAAVIRSVRLWPDISAAAPPPFPLGSRRGLGPPHAGGPHPPPHPLPPPAPSPPAGLGRGSGLPAATQPDENRLVTAAG